jgi:hypothetical protein
MKNATSIRSSYDAENKLGLFMELHEEKAYYQEVLQRIINNPRYYLDNLDDLYVFRVSFIEYKPYKEYKAL